MSGADLSAVKRALAAVREMEGRLSVLREPIAVIGIGCRFPGGANDPESFWRMLRGSVDAIREVPSNRWDIGALYDPDPDTAGKMSTRWGGFLDDVEGFDSDFFELSPRISRNTDPQQRMLLEVSWETLEHAGLPPDEWAGRSVGVFVGIIGSDFARLLNDASQIDPYTGTGAALSIAANRLSYFYDFHGPSLAIDTACSSSLVAVHMAVQSLRAGECELALAGGVNLMLAPEITIQLSRARMMAPDGRCKTFDRAANGFVRGEGCGLVALRRLSDARQAGDRILAVIRGSAVNQDGRSAGLTAPNGRAQAAVIRSAIKQAGVDPEQVTYIEAHGTGTSLGDPIEVEALKETYGRKSAGASVCRIGAVKTNIGHLEAAAGVAGLIKCVLSLHHRTIAPNLNFNTLNPSISLDDSRFELPLQPEPWDGPHRLAAVSSFGFGGTNAHAILEAAPSEAPGPTSDGGGGEFLLPLSARTPEALRELARRYQAMFPVDSLHDLCYSAAVRRSHHKFQNTFRGRTQQQMAAALQAFAGGETSRLVDWRAVYPAGRFVTLPSYPWQHQRYELPRRTTAARRSTVHVSGASVEAKLASLLQASLGRPAALDPDADLQHLGLDSIALLESLSALERQIGARIPLAALRGHPTTVRVLAERIEAFLRGAPSTIAVADGVRIEWVAAGSGPPVVLLPPIGATAAIWENQMDGLAARFRVLTVHYPGYGASTGDLGGASIRNIAAYLGCVLDNLAIAAPVHLVGWSIGGMVAQTFAAVCPHRTASLTLVNTTSRIGLENSFSSAYQLLRGLARDFEETLPTHLEPERERYRELVRAGTEGSYELNLHYADQALEFDGAEALGRVRAPALIVTGERDLLTPPAHGRRLQNAIAGSRYCEVPGAGHYVPLLEPEIFNRELLEFWCGT